MRRADSKQRAKILEAAVRVFGEHGLEAGAIRLVGREAGVNSALLYYYFENKEALCVEACERVFGGLLDELEARRKSCAGNGAARVSLLIDGLWDYYSAQPDRMQFICVTAMLYPRLIRQVIQRLIQNGRLVPLEILQEGIDRGELRPMHPALMWWCIIGMCMFQLRMRDVLSGLDEKFLPARLAHRGEILEFIKQLAINGVVLDREHGAVRTTASAAGSSGRRRGVKVGSK